MDTEHIYRCFLESSGITTDSRKISRNSFFVALRGERFDGNAFAAAALEEGAGYVMVDRPDVIPEDCISRFGKRIIVVQDSLKALQGLANRHRRSFRIPVLGITGTNGKTTTKELLRAVLSKKFNVLATQGNLNNHIGVPLTLLSLRPEHDFAIVEMGASAPGEIKSSCMIAMPTCGLVTNVGIAHLQGFGSFEGVKRTKGELYDFIRNTGGTVYYNSDDSDLSDMLRSRGIDGIKYGIGEDRVKLISDSDGSPYLKFSVGSGDVVETSLVGDYNIANVLAAIKVGVSFGVPEKDIYDAVSGYRPSNSRSQFVKGTTNSIVIDAYNANPSSMEASVRNFSGLPGDDKVFILGDMRELGNDSENQHMRIISLLKTIPFRTCCLVGQEFSKAARHSGFAEDDRVLLFGDSEVLAAYLKDNPLTHSTILVKGSNGVRLDRIFNLLES